MRDAVSTMPCIKINDVSERVVSLQCGTTPGNLNWSQQQVVWLVWYSRIVCADLNYKCSMVATSKEKKSNMTNKYWGRQHWSNMKIISPLHIFYTVYNVHSILPAFKTKHSSWSSNYALAQCTGNQKVFQFTDGRCYFINPQRACTRGLLQLSCVHV